LNDSEDIALQPKAHLLSAIFGQMEELHQEEVDEDEDLILVLEWTNSLVFGLNSFHSPSRQLISVDLLKHGLREIPPTF
jgi:hypothetical protein